MAMQDGLEYLAKLISEKKLTGQDFSVLLYMMSKLDFENYINIPQKQICDELKIKKSNVSTSIKKIIELGILHKGVRIGSCLTYRLDPNFGYKGKSKNISSLDKSIDKARKLGLKVIDSNKKSWNLCKSKRFLFRCQLNIVLVIY